jgi:hypothetical protein
MFTLGRVYLASVKPELVLLSTWTKPNSPDGLVLELNREVGPDHPLFGKTARALAVARDRDDVLFEISDLTAPRYAVVHLTWSGKEEQSGKFPWTEFFDSLEHWLDWMRADHEDYTHGDDDER